MHGEGMANVIRPRADTTGSRLEAGVPPRKCTEFIGFFDISGSYRECAAKSKSFHTLMGQPPGRF